MMVLFLEVVVVRQVVVQIVSLSLDVDDLSLSWSYAIFISLDNIEPLVLKRVVSLCPRVRGV